MPLARIAVIRPQLSRLSNDNKVPKSVSAQTSFVLACCERNDGRIRRRLHIPIANVLSIVPRLSQAMSNGRRQSVVHPKFHAAVTTVIGARESGRRPSGADPRRCPLKTARAAAAEAYFSDLMAPRIFIAARHTCKAMRAYAWACVPHATHRMLLAINSQNPMLRRRSCVDATYHEAATVTSMAGH